MTAREKPLFALAEQLDSLQLADAKQEALTAYLQETVDTLEAQRNSTKPSPDALLPEEETEPSSTEDESATDEEHVFLDWITKRSMQVSKKPLERLPCANVKAEEDWRCDKEGKMACTACKLVSYCSKECQREHWRHHKQDCKDPIRFLDWKPAWIRGSRTPIFTSNSAARAITEEQRQFGLGLQIWGTIPAMDTLNLANNEGVSASQSNLALAYVASGDLKNVLRTVNELPSDFSGELTVLVNDHDPIVALRNVLLLMILGNIENINQAADIALHLWASTFIQTQHTLIYSRASLEFKQALQKDDLFSIKIGNNSTVSGMVSEVTKDILPHYTHYDMPFEEASTELDRVRFEPTRVDRHHRIYCRLEPSHRLSFLEYRRFGIVFPFGAPHSMSAPNKFLFSPDGQWLQDDMASPLESWNVEDVIAGGKAHGAQSADLYGCLYFYLSDQLRTFARRLRKFKISFKVLTEDVRDLSKNLTTGLYESIGLPKDTVFDRIDVSDMIDAEFVGIPNILEDWAPFLNKANQYSAILGHSTSWVPKQHNSQPGDADIKLLTPLLIKMDRIGGQNNSHPDLMPAWFKYYVALYDNSSAFEEYLKKQGTDEAMSKAGVKRRSKHTVIPQRIGARVGDPANALPYFPTDDAWYWNVHVGQALLSERFVEFGLA
ncbi:hypothetical protein CPB84DRAFT_1783894 [Gymnopilus junonius]|uniref:MYND-type domain-containing protein n=1 Tax=Gymnopilus junonius TaxID=109634 RepID=A0A9P5TM24_GYMJU|nr:hypothetical protein CPB84DRAFT_1783894 [Gymnopilus junonius]